jgi:hypothetical protein
MRKVRPVKLSYRKLNGLLLRLIAERITGNPDVTRLGKGCRPSARNRGRHCTRSEIQVHVNGGSAGPVIFLRDKSG